MKLGSALVALAIAATILAFGFVAWYVVNPTPSMSLPSPQVAYLPLSGPHTAIANGRIYYNFTVEGPTELASWGQIHVELQSRGGANISSSSPGLNLTVQNGSGMIIATYDLATSGPVWTVGGSIAIRDGQVIVLSSPASNPLDQDTEVFNLASYGTESFALG